MAKRRFSQVENNVFQYGNKAGSTRPGIGASLTLLHASYTLLYHLIVKELVT
jgi:hypothetical protein